MKRLVAVVPSNPAEKRATSDYAANRPNQREACKRFESSTLALAKDLNHVISHPELDGGDGDEETGDACQVKHVVGLRQNVFDLLFEFKILGTLLLFFNSFSVPLLVLIYVFVSNLNLRGLRHIRIDDFSWRTPVGGSIRTVASGDVQVLFFDREENL